MKLRITAKSDVGQVRDHNEDNFIVNPDLGKKEWYFDTSQIYSIRGEGTLLAVADGMGGLNAGEIASEKAITSVKHYFENLPPIANVDQIEALMSQLFLDANQSIVEHARKNPNTSGMGTTLVLAWLRDRVAHIAWIGDSRAYLFRPRQKDTGPQLLRLSTDHSLVQEWVTAGKLTEEQAFYHPQNNIVTQSLGDVVDKKLAPDYAVEVVYPDDLIILCSDGLNGMLLDEQIQQICQTYPTDPKSIVEELVSAANEAGGVDNITVVIAQMIEADEEIVLPQKKPNLGANKPTLFSNLFTPLMVKVVLLLALLAIFAFGAKQVWDLSNPENKKEKVRESIIDPEAENNTSAQVKIQEKKPDASPTTPSNVNGRPKNTPKTESPKKGEDTMLDSTTNVPDSSQTNKRKAAQPLDPKKQRKILNQLGKVESSKKKPTQIDDDESPVPSPCSNLYIKNNDVYYSQKGVLYENFDCYEKQPDGSIIVKKGIDYYLIDCNGSKEKLDSPNKPFNCN